MSTTTTKPVPAGDTRQAIRRLYASLDALIQAADEARQARRHLYELAAKPPQEQEGARDEN